MELTERAEQHYRYYALVQGVKVIGDTEEYDGDYQKLDDKIYAEFVKEGKPVLKGYEEFQTKCKKIVENIIKQHQNKKGKK